MQQRLNTEQEEGRRATDKGKNFQRQKRICIGSKGAGASEAPGQTKEEFSANDTFNEIPVEISIKYQWISN